MLWCHVVVVVLLRIWHDQVTYSAHYRWHFVKYIPVVNMLEDESAESSKTHTSRSYLKADLTVLGFPTCIFRETRLTVRLTAVSYIINRRVIISQVWQSVFTEVITWYFWTRNWKRFRTICARSISAWRLINTAIYIFSRLAAGFCPKNIGFARVRGLQPPTSPLARTPMDTAAPYGGHPEKIRPYSILPPLSFSWACHEDVATSMSWRHVVLSKARRLAVARPKLSGRRSSSTVLSQVCPLPRYTGSASPVFGRTLKSSRMVLTGVGTTKVSKKRQTPSTDSIWQEWMIRTRPNHVVVGDKIRPYKWLF